MKRTIALTALVAATFMLSSCSSAPEDTNEYIPPEIGQSESTASVSSSDNTLTVIGRLTGSNGSTYLYEITESYGDVAEGMTLTYEVTNPGAKSPGEGCEPALMGSAEVGETFIIDCSKE